MKNFFITIALILVVFIGAISFNYFNFYYGNYDTSTESSNKPDITELISLRNNYQTEYEIISTEIECEEVLRQVEITLYGEIKTQIDFDKIIRRQILKDSIEILNVMINNYQF